MEKKICLLVAMSFMACTNAAGLFSATWQKGPSERFTSLAVDRFSKRVYVSYIDLTKEKGPNGVIKIINTAQESTTAPELQVLRLPAEAPVPISPIAIRCDECNNLWILDTAVQNISGTQVKTTQPTIQSVNLRGNKGRSSMPYQLPDYLISKESFLATFTLHTTSECDNTTIYIADFNRPALIAYYVKESTSGLFKHHYFNPDPMQTDVPNEMIFNTQQRDISGIFGLVAADEKLYFHPLASLHEFSINLTAISSPETALAHKDVVIEFDRPNLAGTSVYDPINAVFFYAEFKGIGCRGHKNIYTKVRTPELKNKINDAYVTDLAINDTSLWILLNSNNNFDIVELNIVQLTKGTDCALDTTTDRFVTVKIHSSAPKETAKSEISESESTTIEPSAFPEQVATGGAEDKFVTSLITLISGLFLATFIMSVIF